MLNFILTHKAEILGFLFGLSEGLAAFPQVKANSVFQLIFGMLKRAIPNNESIEVK